MSEDALRGIRVLDLSGAAGNYCGKLFADLGADVILVEPPGGTELRHRGPHIDDRAGLETSLSFLHQNTNKRSLALNLDRPQGQNILRRLAARADLLIETGKPGAMAARGLGSEELRRGRPSLVYTSITSFGQTGPYAHYEADDLTLMAMGGLLYLAGFPDGPPIVAYGQQAYGAASLFAAIASLMAVYRAEPTGEGEYIDVSIQESVAMGLENAAQTYDLTGVVRKRSAGMVRRAGEGLYPCKDGLVYMLAAGIGETKLWDNFVAWMREEGISAAVEFNDPKWVDLTFLETDGAKDRFAAIFGPFALRRTKLELYDAARVRRIAMAPIATPADVLQSRQLQHRGFFVSYGADHLGKTITMPGAPYQLSRTPWRLRRPAPRLGEHNGEILAELGIGADDSEKLHREGIV
jgi:benzylsuccinate CoA-transferase BbsE subunit